MADIFKLSKISYIAIFGTSIGTFSSGILEPTIAPYLEILGLSSKEIGSILAARFLMTAILSIPFAMISSRIGEIKVLKISSIFLISSVFLLRYVEGSNGVHYFLIIVGLASASSSGPTAAILANNSGDKRVAAFALYSITWMLPPAIGSGISAYWFRGVLSYNVQSLSSIFFVVF